MNTNRRIFHASLLYLTSMLLVVTLGSYFQRQSFSLGLIATELVCILLPALVYLRLTGQRIADALPVRWPGWKIALLCLALGAAAWQVDAVIEGVSMQVSGYRLFVSPDAYPTSVGAALLLLAALVIAAPVCEEILFRGVLLGGYLPLGASFALRLSSALFIFFHMRLQGFAALILVAFVLGWVAVRTRSLAASILAHMANNAFAAAAILSAASRPDAPLALVSGPGVLASVGVLLAGVYLLRRATTDRPADQPFSTRGWLLHAWPLAIALLIFGVVVAGEYRYGNMPETLARGQRVTLEAPLAAQPARLEYDITNRAGDVVGSANCDLASGASQSLECEWQVRAYDINYGGGRWLSGGFTRTFVSQWAAGQPGLRFMTWENHLSNATWTFSAQPAGDDLLGRLECEGSSLGEAELDAGALLADELPWRLSALPFESGYARLARVIEPDYAASPDAPVGPAVQDRLVIVDGGEPLALPAGKFIAWRVRIGERQVAWYEQDAPHRLLKYDDGVQVWQLK